jgi:hypothetical protein
VPTAAERLPLTTDVRLRPIVERLLAAYPAELPNRPDVNPRALNTNAPQRIEPTRSEAVWIRESTRRTS